MRKYHPFLVTLHWLMVLMIPLSLTAGGIILANLPNDNPGKVTFLGGHMGFGLTIGAVLLVRLITRIRSTHPARATTGNEFLDRISLWTHWGFYVLIGGMVVTGLATALGAGLLPIVFAGSGDPLPATFDGLPQLFLHGFCAVLLIALIVLHLLAALYHQFILKDGLMARMWYGKRD